MTIASVVETDLVASKALSELETFTLRGDDGSVTQHPYIPDPPTGQDIQV
jgi:hypothetical protein